MSLSILARKRVQYALGYLGLGLTTAAEAELQAVPEAERTSAEVRSVWIDLAMAAHDWKKVVELGSELAREHPSCENAWIGWAYALRELMHISDAREVLRIGEIHHGGTSAVLHYNLACYDSLLGDLESARARLATACQMEPRFKAESATDPDLAQLRAADRERRSKS